MKKIVTVLALLSLVMTSRAGITGSYDYGTKTLTVNYVYVANPYDANDDGINPSDLNYLNLNAGMVDRIVLTGEWKNKNMQKAGELVIKYASRQDPVELDLSACKGLVSKFKSVTDYINVQDFDNTTTTFSYEPMWGETFNLDKEVENGALYGWQFGPVIIRDGEEGPGATSYGGMGYKARNILGYYEPGHYVVVTCDNQHKNANGMDAQMMINLMKSLGVKEAFNLDGGTSAVLVFMGEVINRPTTETVNGKTVYGRPLLDMFVFGECGEDGNFVDLSTLTASKFKAVE